MSPRLLTAFDGLAASLAACASLISACALPDGDDGSARAPVEAPATASAPPLYLGLSAPPLTAYQDAGHVLWVNGTSTGYGMMPGTSPAVATLANGYAVAFQANTGDLWIFGTPGAFDTGLGMMAGTSPSITAVSYGVGYVVAFQANTGHLWAYGATSGDMDDGMAAGTSPAIASLSGNRLQIAFQASNHDLYMRGDAEIGDTGLGMLVGTSPSIAAVPYDVGYTVAFQANTQHAWMYGANNGDLGNDMMAGTSPSIASLPGNQLEIAFQDSGGTLYTTGDARTGDTGRGMMAGTSPSLSPIASGGYVIAFQANTGDLWTFGSTAQGDSLAGLSTGTSPALASSLPAQSTAGATPNTFAAPALTGTYATYLSGSHPFVFTNAANMTALLEANTPASSAALAHLEALVKSELANASLTNTNGSPYIGPYAGNVISDGSDCVDAPYCSRFGESGAPYVATDLATYAYLTQLSAQSNLGYGSAATAASASAFARQILLAWASQGFLRNSGAIVEDSTQYQGESPAAPDPNSVSLFLGEGMIAWVQAQDMLLAVDALSTSDQTALDAFLVAMQGLIDNALPHTFDPGALGGNGDVCNFGNQASSNILATLAIAQLRRDQARIEAIADNRYGATTLIPWTTQIQQNIYGVGETDACTVASDGSQLAQAAPGEILDRNRREQYQIFGYPTASLAHLLLAGEILQNDGFGALAYQASQQQSLELASKYYDYYFGNYISAQVKSVVPAVATPDNGDEQAYADFATYVGAYTSSPSQQNVTITGQDDSIDDWVIAQRDFPRAAFNALNRVRQLSTTATLAFSRVPTSLIDRLGDRDLQSSDQIWRFNDRSINFAASSIGPSLNSEGWEPGPNGQLTLVTPSSAGLTMATTGTDPQLWSPPLDLCATASASCATAYHQLQITLSADSSLPTNLIQVFWDVTCGPSSAVDCDGFDEQHVASTTVLVDSTARTYTIDLASAKTWGAQVYRLRIDPTTTANANLHIESITLTP